MPVTAVYSEDGADIEAENMEDMEDTEEEEDPIPESYYYPIESNDVQGWPRQSWIWIQELFCTARTQRPNSIPPALRRS